jgi:prepilin-type N-terminal cleavage/methylation domain-containing protein
MTRRLGFSLVELLVVIGLVAVLLGILLPVLAGAREGSRSTICLSNLRQLGMALQRYSDDQNGYLVPFITGTNARSWEIKTWPQLLYDGRYLSVPLDRTDRTGIPFSAPRTSSSSTATPKAFTILGYRGTGAMWTITLAIRTSSCGRRELC